MQLHMTINGTTEDDLLHGARALIEDIEKSRRQRKGTSQLEANGTGYVGRWQFMTNAPRTAPLGLAEAADRATTSK